MVAGDRVSVVAVQRAGRGIAQKTNRRIDQVDALSRRRVGKLKRRGQDDVVLAGFGCGVVVKLGPIAYPSG